MGINRTEVKIALTGDTHFAKPSSFDQPKTIQEFAASFCEIDPNDIDLVIHAGDITGEGSLDVALDLAAAIKNSKSLLLALPGNRDLRNGDAEEFRKNLTSTGKIKLIDESAYTFEKDGKIIVVTGAIGVSGGFGRSIYGYPRFDPEYINIENQEIEKAKKQLANHSDADALIVVSHYPLLLREEGRTDLPTDTPSRLAEFFLGTHFKTKLFIHGHFHDDIEKPRMGGFENVNASLGLRGSGVIFSQHTLEVS